MQDIAVAIAIPAIPAIRRFLGAEVERDSPRAGD